MSRRPVRTTNQIKCLLDACDDWDVLADLPKWDSHSSILKETSLEEAHIYKSQKYQNLTNELGICRLQSCGGDR